MKESSIFSANLQFSGALHVALMSERDVCGISYLGAWFGASGIDLRLEALICFDLVRRKLQSSFEKKRIQYRCSAVALFRWLQVRDMSGKKNDTLGRLILLGGWAVSQIFRELLVGFVRF